MLSIFWGSIQLIGIGVICIFEYKKKSAAVFLWGTLFIMFGIMHFMTTIVGSDMYQRQVIDDASYFVCLFCSIYILVRITLSSLISLNYDADSIYSPKEDSLYRFFLIMFVIVLIVKMRTFIVYSGGIMNASWLLMREFSTLNSNILFAISTRLFFVFSTILLLALMKRNRKHIWLISILLIFNMALFKNRIEITPIIVSPFIYLMCYKKVKLSPRNVSIFILSVLFFLYVVYFIRAVRWYGSLDSILQEATLADINERVLFFLKTDDGELGLRNGFYYFISKDNNFPGFGEGATYLRLLLIAIPTDLSFGLKPEDFALTMGMSAGMEAGGSMHPTLFGDCYANFGFIGWLLGGVWAGIVSILDKITSSLGSLYQSSFVCLLGIGYIMIARGAVYSGYYCIFFGLIIIILLRFIFMLNIKKIRLHL